MRHESHHREEPASGGGQGDQEKARKEKLSLNRAIVKLLEQATGVGTPKEKVLHHDLDHLAGTWSDAEYRDFMAALQEQRQIDPEMWK